MPDPSQAADLMQSVNFPGLIVLAVAGIPTLFYIVRWMVNYQRDFTTFYIDENNKLRIRIDTLEAEVVAKDDKITAATRAALQYEQDTSRRIFQLESTIERHEATIASLQAKIARLEGGAT